MLEIVVGVFFAVHATLLQRPNPARLQGGMKYILEMAGPLRSFSGAPSSVAFAAHARLSVYIPVYTGSIDIVKVRRVGNSNVVTLPRSYEERGYAAGTEVAVEQLEDGELRIVPAARLRDMIRAAGRRVVVDDREALQILADHDADR